MSILYFSSARQEPMVIYKTVEAAQQRWKWRPLEPALIFIPNGVEFNTPFWPFSILLTNSLESIAFEVYF